MRVILPVCHKDEALALANLIWCRELAVPANYECVVSHDTSFDPSQVVTAAQLCFSKVEIISYEPWRGENQNWPSPQNWAWQRTAEQKHTSPWLWWEADATPLCKDWLEQIDQEYIKGGKPFMGWVGNGEGHMNGVAVYPANVMAFSTNVFICRAAPFDMLLWPSIKEQTHRCNHLIEYRLRANGIPYPIHDHSTILELQRRGIVLFHACNDGSAIERLREIRDNRPMAKIKRWLNTGFFISKTDTKTIHVHRSAAIGDVIMASAVAQNLHSQGHRVTFSSKPVCLEVLQGQPYALGTDSKRATVNLDGAYEHSHETKIKPVPLVFSESTATQLAAREIGYNYHRNLTPQLVVDKAKQQWLLDKLCMLPKPWVGICPRSNTRNVRSVPSSTWAEAVKAKTKGTWIWTGTDPAPEGFHDFKLRDLQHLMALLSVCDLVVSVDTGPMHIAAGVGVPLIAVKQANDPALRLTDQRDFNIISAALDCLNCCHTECPINRASPPCGLLNPRLIADAVANKLESIYTDKVSAIIPVYSPNPQRLHRCLGGIINQVDEVVIALDGNANLNSCNLPSSPKLKIVQHPSGIRRGYGKTCNYGARHSSGRWLLMLNDDVYLDQGAVARMRAAANDAAAAVGCRLNYPNGRIQHGGTQRANGDIGWGHIDWKMSRPSIKITTEMENVTYAAALLRRSAFYKVLGFDERYDCYWEDGDLNMKLRQAGWKVMYEPAATGTHEESASTSHLKRQLAQAGEIIFREKWATYFDRNKNNQLGTFT